MLSPRFRGVLVTQGTGTVLNGQFEMTDFEKASYWLFLIGTLVALSYELSFVINGEDASNHVGKFIGCLALLPFLILVIRLGWRIRRDDIEAIEAMLKEALNV